MSTKAELQALLERMKAATGPDREIDDALYDFERRSHIYRPGEALMTADHEYTPPYTASLDAITALIEQELPGHDWLRKSPGTMTVYRRLSPTEDAAKVWAVHHDARGATPALALTAAFLSAMIAQMEPSHAE